MRVRFFLLTAWLLIATSPLARGTDSEQRTKGALEDEDKVLPSIELLEFLGEWEDEDGEWLDPAVLDLMFLPGAENSDE
jgi:hypothetical protein